LVQLGLILVDTRAEIRGITAESNVKVLEELVAAGEERFGSVGASLNTWLTVKDNNAICEVSCHDEIVLDDESSLLGVDNVSSATR